MKKQRVNSSEFDHPGSATVPPRLSSRLEKRLASYALAADAAGVGTRNGGPNNHRLIDYAVGVGVAGVGLLALAPPAEADIIYTPAAISMRADNPRLSSYFPMNLNGPPLGPTPLPPSLRGSQGQLSFAAWRSYCKFCLAESARIGVRAAPGNALAVGPLVRGYRIGAGARFTGGAGLDSWKFGTLPSGTFVSFSYGPWANSTGYIGVRFLIGGGTHYGWVALSASKGTGTVSGYAYETFANEAIRAGQTTETPEPATLGLLALGSLGIAAWRRKKAVTSDK